MSREADRKAYGERLQGLVRGALDKGDPRGLLKTAASREEYEAAVKSLAGKLRRLRARPTPERLTAMAKEALTEMTSAGSMLVTALDYALMAQMISDGLSDLVDVLDVDLP
jgi:hypothetical protein